MAAASAFVDITLPNPTTWFYFSGLLAVALFFKFSRLLSMRNLDVLTLYLFMPGLLLLADTPFHLPEKALASLQGDGVPESVVSWLNDLTDRDYKTRDDFSHALVGVLES